MASGNTRQRREISAEETELLDGLRRGDDQAFETLVRTHGGRMLAVARRVTGNEDDARDCVQDGFLQAFRKIDTFEGRSSLSSWLHRIVVNAALMRLRSKKRKAEVSIDDLQPTFKDDDGCRLEPTYSALRDDDLGERMETQDAVRKAVQELPEDYCNVLLLRDIQGLSTDEAAAQLGITAAAAKVRLHRARNALKKKLEPVLRGETGDERRGSE